MVIVMIFALQWRGCQNLPRKWTVIMIAQSVMKRFPVNNLQNSCHAHISIIQNAFSYGFAIKSHVQRAEISLGLRYSIMIPSLTDVRHNFLTVYFLFFNIIFSRESPELCHNEEEAMWVMTKIGLWCIQWPSMPTLFAVFNGLLWPTLFKLESCLMYSMAFHGRSRCSNVSWYNIYYLIECTYNVK